MQRKWLLILILCIISLSSIFAQTMFKGNQVYTDYPDDPPLMLRITLQPTKITIFKKRLIIESDGELISIKARKKIAFDSLNAIDCFLNFLEEKEDYALYKIYPNKYKIIAISLTPDDEDNSLKVLTTKYETGMRISYNVKQIID